MLYTSNMVTVVGIDLPVAVSVNTGLYTVDGGLTRSGV
jgi:hypothetical protein